MSSENNVHIILEFAAGGTLHCAIEKQAALKAAFATAQLRKWTRQLTEALTYLHDCSVVHRDLSTKNILLAAPALASAADGYDAGYGYITSDIRIADFGVSRVLSKSLVPFNINSSKLPSRPKSSMVSYSRQTSICVA